MLAGPGDSLGPEVFPIFRERWTIQWSTIDDDGAIQELERMRAAGATHIVFASYALWWLDYYAELSVHLRRKYTCILDDPNLTVFDIRNEARANQK
jgi:hypothetical protein